MQPGTQPTLQAVTGQCRQHQKREKIKREYAGDCKIADATKKADEMWRSILADQGSEFRGNLQGRPREAKRRKQHRLRRSTRMRTRRMLTRLMKTTTKVQDNLLKYNEVNCVDKKWCGMPLIEDVWSGTQIPWRRQSSRTRSVRLYSACTGGEERHESEGTAVQGNHKVARQA